MGQAVPDDLGRGYAFHEAFWVVEMNRWRGWKRGVRVLAGACCGLLWLGMSAQVQSGGGLALDPAMDVAVIPLRGAGAPGVVLGPDVPTLTVFLPQHGRANGTAVIVAPGGAYLGLATNLEGRQVADWFAARGVTAFVLKYRLGPQHLYPVPLEDAQRAIRLVRSMSKAYGLQDGRVGMVGFSAGGHLAATAGTLFTDGNPGDPDPVERLSDRPDFLVLGYPWLNAMQPNNRGMITYCSLIKMPADTCKVNEQKYTPSLHVTSRTPPTFIFSTTDDAIVPVRASVDFYDALEEAGVSAELHIFRHGGHGSGLGSGDPALDQWPVLLEQWLRDEGLLGMVSPVARVLRRPRRGEALDFGHGGGPTPTGKVQADG